MDIINLLEVTMVSKPLTLSGYEDISRGKVFTKGFLLNYGGPEKRKNILLVLWNSQNTLHSTFNTAGI